MGAFVGAALAGLNALSGAFGSKKQTSTTNSSTTPIYDEPAASMRSWLINSYGDLMGGQPKFEENYKMGGVSNIQKSSNILDRSISDMLAARGLGRTTAGGSTMLDTGYRSGKDIADFLTQVPLTMDKRRQDILGQAGSFLSSMPTGSRSTSTTTGNIAPSSPFAGALEGGASGIGAYLGQYAAQQNFSKLLKSMKPTSGGMFSQPTSAEDYWAEP